MGRWLPLLITLNSKKYSTKSVLMQHQLRRHCIQTLYLGKICHSLLLWSKKVLWKFVFGTSFSQNLISPVLLYRKLNFLIFVRVHVIVTSQKPNDGGVGTLWVIKIRRDSKQTLVPKLKHPTKVHFKNLIGSGNHLSFVTFVTKMGKKLLHWFT